MSRTALHACAASLALTLTPGCYLVHERVATDAAADVARPDTTVPHACDTLDDVLAGGCRCEAGPFVQLVDANRQEAHLATTAHGVFVSAWGDDVRPYFAPIALAPDAQGVLAREARFGVTGTNDPILVADETGEQVALAWYEISATTEVLLSLRVAIARTSDGAIVGHDSIVEDVAGGDRPITASVLAPLEGGGWRVVRVDEGPTGPTLVTHDVRAAGDPSKVSVRVAR